MIFEISELKNNKKLIRAVDIWKIQELDLENLIVSNVDENNYLLDENIFGEELFFIKKEVHTKEKKRADILALDRNGSAVIIELKRDQGLLGVETQALQYLAYFSNYRGEDFIEQFCKDKRSDIEAFVDVDIKNINSQSRIILMARYFDPSLFSMGKWLSENGVSFKCISYTPLKLACERKELKYLNFSVVFELLSSNFSYKLEFRNTIRRKPKKFWHIIGNSKNKDVSDEDWWKYLRENNKISASFDNSKGDKGEKILKKYIKDDEIFAYMSGKGLIAYGKIENPASYELVNENDEKKDILKGSHMHRLDCSWKYVAESFEKAISPKELQALKIHHPIMTSSEIKKDTSVLLKEIKNNFLSLDN